MPEICIFPECGRPSKSKKLCGSHYQQQYDGKPLTPIIPRTKMTKAQYTEDGLRICSKCGEAKDPTTGFYKNSGSQCRVCHGIQCKEWRIGREDQLARIQREWRELNEGHVYTDKNTGYEIYVGYNHPAANTCGITRYHRIVLWEKIGGGIHPCNWCGTSVTWEKSYPVSMDGLVVDHIDWNKTNNDPNNLVPSCNKCNTSKARRRINVQTSVE